jgi:hypothetical protein
MWGLGGAHAPSRRGRRVPRRTGWDRRERTARGKGAGAKIAFFTVLKKSLPLHRQTTGYEPAFYIPHPAIRHPLCADAHLLRKRKGLRNGPISYLAPLGFLLFDQPIPNKFGLAFAHASVWLKILQLRFEHLAQYGSTGLEISVVKSVCLLRE